MDYRMGIAIEGERCNAIIGKRSLGVSFDDYREDSHYIDPNQAALMADIDAESIEDLKEIARCALDTMPDISCSAIAGALGLKLHSVIAMSNGRHNKAKRRGVSRGIELAEVTREELIENYRQQWSQ